MNANDVIREELAIAQERIIARLTAMFMGGDAPPAPRVHTPAPIRTAHSDFSSHPPITVRPTGRAAMGTNREQKNRIGQQAERDVADVLAYVAANPGCYGKGMMQAIGCESASDRRYINVTKRMRVGRFLIMRGKGRMQTYFINPDSPIGQTSLPLPNPVKGKGPGKGRGQNAPDVGDPDARDERLVAYVKKYPDTTPPDLRDHFAGKQGMGSGAAIMSAIHRLSTTKKRLKKRPAPGGAKGRGGAPVMALRAIK